MKMSLTTLCYLEKDECYLMMHRVKKVNDENKDKWIGVGGHAEDYESPEDCLLREVKEETGLTLTKYRFRGIITFSLLGEETQYMCLYTATEWKGEMVSECLEGNLEWVPKSDIHKLSLWTGDKVFFELLDKEYPFFSLRLTYEKNRLISCVLDGKELEYLDIVDEKGIPTGYIKERTLMHRDGDLHRTSHVWIARHHKGKIQLLLQKRSASKDSHPGCFDISSAGHIPAGDDFKESALRELSEELGILIDENRLHECGIRRIQWQDTFHGKSFVDNQISKVFLLWHDLDESKIFIQESEIESVCWIELGELLDAVRENSIPHCIAMEELLMLHETIQNTCGNYTIEKAALNDIEEILALEQKAYQLMPIKEWYVPDDLSFLERHIEKEGFILKAVSPEETIAGFLVVRYPKDADDNLFFDIKEICCLKDGEQFVTAHMESVAVDPAHRGYHLQEQLIREGTEIAASDGYKHFCATVHPDNKYSRRNGDAAGFECVCEKEKYGGLRRCIYYKKLS